MIRISVLLLQALLLVSAAWGEAKPHVIAFGKWSSVSWYNTEHGPAIDRKVRPLYVDGRLREFTLELPHDITDRLFTVQRAFRINDTLPGENTLRWRWEPGGWVLVDRGTGRISSLSLAEFDATLSRTGWYRDYAAYCGVSEDGKKMYAVVTQLGRRRPLLRESLGDLSSTPEPCPVPSWQRDPARVTFAPAGKSKATYAIHGHMVAVVPDEEGPGADTSENQAKPIPPRGLSPGNGP
jgi:hypothetical protein